MRCSLKNKSLTPNNKKRGRLLIHIPGVWSDPSQETSNVHDYRERLLFYLRLLLRPNFGMSNKQQTLYFYPQKSHRCLRSDFEVSDPL